MVGGSSRKVHQRLRCRSVSALHTSVSCGGEVGTMVRYPVSTYSGSTSDPVHVRLIVLRF